MTETPETTPNIPEAEKLRQKVEHLELEVAHWKRRATRAEHLSTKDDLTGDAGVYNRRGLREEYDRIISQNMAEDFASTGRKQDAEKTFRPVTVMHLDINDFKKFNDSKGHAFGDKVIQALARTLTDRFRKADVLARMTPDEEKGKDEGATARVGGDEFVAIFPGTAERDILDSGRLNLDLDIDGEKITVSVGLATILTGEGLDQVIARADEAMYKAKELYKSKRAGSEVMAYGDLDEPEKAEKRENPSGVEDFT